MRRRGLNRLPRQSGPAGLRLLLERLGPTWVRCSQYLALRPDVIPQAYCEELMHAVDVSRPLPWELAEAVIADDLGGDPVDLFSSIERTPVVSGWLSQIHRAQLADGTEVSVKVQRPGARERVESDFARPDPLIRALTAAGVPLAMPPSDLVAELHGWMRRELDLEHELRNVERLHELARGRAPFRRLSGQKVLTVESLRGVPFSDLVRGLRSGRWDAASVHGRLDLDLDQLAENLLSACLTQILSYRFFEADLHPANLVAGPGNVIGFTGFGLFEDLDDTVGVPLTRFLGAVYDGDVARMYEALAAIFDAPDDLPLAEFRAEFSLETRARLADGGGAPLTEWMVGVLRLAHAHGLRLPSQVLSLFRALFTAETVAAQLGAEADLRSVGNEFRYQQRLRELVGRLGESDIEALAVNLSTLLRDGPGQVHQALSAFEEGRFALPVDAARAPRAVTAQRRRERVVAAAALSTALAVVTVRVDVAALPALLAMMVVYAFILRAWWRLR